MQKYVRILLLAIIVLLLTIREKELAGQIAEEYPDEEDTVLHTETGELPKEVKKSLVFILLSIFLWFTAYNAVTTAFSRYAITVWKMEGGGFANCLMVATVSAIISYIPIGIISSKIGRKKTVIAGVVILFVAFFLAIFVSKDTAILIWVALALAGIGWATINVNSYPMIVEMATGNNVGKYTGIYYTASMAAQIATPVLSGWFMDIFGMRYTLFAYSTVFSLLALITMLFVKHGDSKPIPKDSLSTFEDLGD